MWTQKKKKKYLLVKPTSDYFHSAIRESIWTIVPYNPCVLFPLSANFIVTTGGWLSPVDTLPHEQWKARSYAATSILSLLVRMDRSCKAPPSGRQGRAFLHLARFLLLYLFLLLPAPRFPVDNLLPPLLRFSGCPMLLAQCPSPYLPTSPLLVSRVLSFSSFLSFHFSTCCFLICLTSHASRPPFSLFLSAVLCIPVPRTIENCASSMKDSTAYSWRFLSPSF